MEKQQQQQNAVLKLSAVVSFGKEHCVEVRFNAVLKILLSVSINCNA